MCWGWFQESNIRCTCLSDVQISKKKEGVRLLHLTPSCSVSGWLDSNQRPHAPQTRTLTGLSYTPNLVSGAKVRFCVDLRKSFSVFLIFFFGKPWIRSFRRLGIRLIGSLIVCGPSWLVPPGSLSDRPNDTDVCFSGLSNNNFSRQIHNNHHPDHVMESCPHICFRLALHTIPIPYEPAFPSSI